MQKRWKILSGDEGKTLQLQQSLGINKKLCSILVQRKIDTFDKARNFFRPQLSHLHDPWLMKDMLKAVNRIISAINNKEKILVFGDYDVDGTTAVACMYQFLKSTGTLTYLFIFRIATGKVTAFRRLELNLPAKTISH